MVTEETIRRFKDEEDCGIILESTEDGWHIMLRYADDKQLGAIGLAISMALATPEPNEANEANEDMQQSHNCYKCGQPGATQKITSYWILVPSKMHSGAIIMKKHPVNLTGCEEPSPVYPRHTGEWQHTPQVIEYAGRETLCRVSRCIWCGYLIDAIPIDTVSRKE